MSIVRLNKISSEDTPLIVKWRNNDNVRNNFIFQEKFTEAMHNEWLNTKVASGEVIQFIIAIKDTSKKIGSVYFRDIDYSKGVAEYGIFIGEDDARGKGYGTEAAKLALKYVFDEVGLKKVFLRVFADNVSAIKSYEKVGFRINGHEEVVRIGDSDRKVIFMEIDNKRSDDE